MLFSPYSVPNVCLSFVCNEAGVSAEAATTGQHQMMTERLMPLSFVKSSSMISGRVLSMSALVISEIDLAATCSKVEWS